MTILQRMLSLWKMIFVLTIILLFVAGCKQNVVDYYNELPTSIFADKDLGNIKYPLSKKGDTWIAQSFADYEFNPIVDLANGYIDINDEGTGGGNVLLKVVLFRKSDEAPIIAVSKGGFNGMYTESSITFYEKLNNTWVEATDVFPSIEIDRFLHNKYKERSYKKDAIVTPNLTTLTELPQVGTRLNVYLNFNKFDYLIASNQNPLTYKSFTETEREKLGAIIDNIAIESFELKFDKIQGKFEIQDSTFLKIKEVNQDILEQDDAKIIHDESDLLERVWQLKEVKKLATYIDSASSQTRQLKLLFDGEDTEDPDFSLVKAVEDNGSNYVTHLIFRIHNKNFEISKYDVVEDVFIKIEQ